MLDIHLVLLKDSLSGQNRLPHAKEGGFIPEEAEAEKRAIREGEFHVCVGAEKVAGGTGRGDMNLKTKKS